MNNQIIVAVPVKLIGEGEYNINVFTQIKITDSFLGLDKDIRKCQNDEPYLNCTTRKYHETLLSKCGCLPFNIRRSDKVYKLQNISFPLSTNFDLRIPFVQKRNKIVSAILELLTHLPVSIPVLASLSPVFINQKGVVLMIQHRSIKTIIITRNLLLIHYNRWVNM